MYNISPPQNFIIEFFQKIKKQIMDTITILHLPNFPKIGPTNILRFTSQKRHSSINPTSIVSTFAEINCTYILIMLSKPNLQSFALRYHAMYRPK